MIYGIGNDITNIADIKKAMQNPKFAQKCFTDAEIEWMEQRPGRMFEIAAGNFSVKESLSKALGTGVRGFWMTDAEVLRDDLGKPYVKAYGKLLALLEERRINRIFVSISHTKELVSTTAILETDAAK